MSFITSYIVPLIYNRDMRKKYTYIHIKYCSMCKYKMLKKYFNIQHWNLKENKTFIHFKSLSCTKHMMSDTFCFFYPSGMCHLASCSWLAVRLWKWKMWFCWSLVWGSTFLPLSWATSSMVALSCLLSTLGSLVKTPSVFCLASSHLSPQPLLPALGNLFYVICSPKSRFSWANLHYFFL